MINVCLYLHAHQPFRLKPFSIFDINYYKETNYFDILENQKYLKRVIEKSYLPANDLFLKLIHKTQGKFKISFSLGGLLLEQLERYFPQVLKSFQDIYNTGSCELIAETYYHSLACYFSEKEFIEQNTLHKNILKKLFNAHPTIFRNTELLYYDKLAPLIYKLGYQGVLIEGADKILQGQSPNFVYNAYEIPELKLLLKNYRLSDDIAFRFSERNWKEFPLMVDKFLNWLENCEKNEGIINLFMDYETFGEHQWQETGIFEFLEDLILKIAQREDFQFITPIEALNQNKSIGSLHITEPLTWADTERDLSAWMGNELQQSALADLYNLEDKIAKKKDKQLLDAWRKLQTSDHFYYMCTKWFSDGDVHKYFNPYESPYESYINYMNVLRDLENRIIS
jgi:alpha-amylase